MDQDPNRTVIVRFRNLRDYGITFSRPHVNKLVKEKLFPAPVELSARVVGWRLSDLEDWLANRPVRRPVGRPHSDATKLKMKQAWIRRRARNAAKRKVAADEQEAA